MNDVQAYENALKLAGLRREEVLGRDGNSGTHWETRAQSYFDGGWVVRETRQLETYRWVDQLYHELDGTLMKTTVTQFNSPDLETQVESEVAPSEDLADRRQRRLGLGFATISSLLGLSASMVAHELDACWQGIAFTGSGLGLTSWSYYSVRGYFSTPARAWRKLLSQQNS